MTKLVDFLCSLDKRKIHYRIEHNHDDAVIVIADVPGQKWEVEFFTDGNVEIEIFKSNGEILEESELERFFREFAD